MIKPMSTALATALLTVAALLAVGLGCGSQEDSGPVATTLTHSERAPGRPLPSPGAADSAETALSNAPGIRDRVSGATTRSAEGARSDPMDPTREADTAKQAEPRPEPDDPDSEARAAEQAELFSDLDSPDPDTRVDAADWIDLEGEALERMIAQLKSDPDAEVRATIVDRLGEEVSPSTLAALVGALGDRDPEVVLRAIEVLEFEAEDWLIPELEPLLAHSDPEVREAAQDAIAFLK